MNEYYFLYKNATGEWNSTTNPMFIAKHTYCRAIPKANFDKLNIGFFLSDLTNLLNSENKIENKKIIDFINLFELN